MTPALRAYPPAHGPPFVLPLAVALCSMHFLLVLMLPAFDAELLAAAPGTLTHLMLLTDSSPMRSSTTFLPREPAHVSRTSHYPTSLSCPLQHTTSHPPLLRTFSVLDSSPGLAAALTYFRLLHRVALRIASALNDGLCPAALFSALGGSLRELVLVLAPDVGVHTRGRLLGAQENTDAGLEVLELSLDRTSDEVSLQVLYKQVSSLLSNVQALRTLRLQASLPTEAAEADGSSLRLVLWMRSPLGSALPSVVFPSEAHWEPERGE